MEATYVIQSYFADSLHVQPNLMFVQFIEHRIGEM